MAAPLLPVADCGRGLNLDLPPSELAPGVWSDASNVRFRNGVAEKRGGFFTAYTTPTAVPYWIGTYNTATTRFLVQLGTATGFVDDGTTRTDITGTPPTGGRDDRWTAFNFNGTFVCNNGVDLPWFWNGNTATNLAALTNWPAATYADALCMYRDYIVALAVTSGGTKYPFRIRWGNAAEPGALPTTYTAAATNDAGEKDLMGIGNLIDGRVMGDALIVYGQEGMYEVRWIGGNDVFSFRRIAGGSGLLARGCVVSCPVGHVALTNGDVRLFNGAESVSIAEGVVRSYLTSTMDSTYATRSFVCINPQKTEVWICYPSTGQTECDTVLAWNWVDKTWAKFTAPSITYGTAGLVSSTLAATTYSALDSSVTYETITSSYSQNEASSNEVRLIVSTSTPKIGLANVGSLDFGTRISWYAEKTGIPLSPDADSVRPISRLRLRADAVAGTTVTVKTATTMNPDDSPTYSGSATYTHGTTNYANNFTNAGRYASVRFEGADDQPIVFKSYQIEVPQSGARW